MRLPLVLLVIATVLSGAAGAVGATWMVRHAQAEPSNLHDVIHKHISLNGEERGRLAAAEAAYGANRAAIEARLHAANLHLAQAIRADPRMTPEVTAASAEVEAAAAELQGATLKHVFEMRAALEPQHRAEYDEVLIRALTREP